MHKAADRGRTKSKHELEVETAAAREIALATALPTTSKGFQMMAKLGFKQGSGLGPEGNVCGRLEPLEIEIKGDRGGIGLSGERKRKIQGEAEVETKKVRAEQTDFRERLAREQGRTRMERLVEMAMRIAERMDQDKEPGLRSDSCRTAGAEQEKEQEQKQKVGLVNSGKASNPTRQINVLWRGLVRERERAERQLRIRYNLHQGFSQYPHYGSEEEKYDSVAYDREEEIESEDSELDAFSALEPAKRLRRLVEFLRQTYYYCFWCKCCYNSPEMDGCPGLDEDDHD